MKVVLLTCVFWCVVLSTEAAPTFDGKPINRQQLEEFLRERRSQYGPQFVSPCAAASYSNPNLGMTYPHVHPHYAYGAPHYRSVDDQLAGSELLSFSDFDHFIPDHMPMARLGGYGAAGSIAPISNQILPATTATMYGVFPNANMGGYSVPLLLSCSPNVVSGHMMDAQGTVTSIAAPPNSYRGVDELGHLHEHQEEMTSQEHSSTMHEPSKVAFHSH